MAFRFKYSKWLNAFPAILILSFGIPLLSQQYEFRVETIPLKGEMVNFSGSCFLQDSDGFIWFGSRDGLYRYSGNGLKIFRNVPDTPGSLASSNIYSLFEDSKGVMWVGTFWGLYRFNDTTETFKYYEPLGDSTGPSFGGINMIMEDEEGLVWFAIAGGFSSFNWKSETFSNYYIPREDGLIGSNNYQVYGIYSDWKGSLWLTCINGLYRFCKATGSLERVEAPVFTWSIYEDRSGRSWLITDHGLYLFNIPDYSFERCLDDPDDPNCLRNENIRAMSEDHEGNIWVRTMDGLNCYTQDLDLIVRLEHDQVYPETNDMREMTGALLVDHTGSIWYYTPDGINQVIHGRRNFRVYDYHETTRTSVNCIYPESKDRIWYGSALGICSLDRDRNTCKVHYGGEWESGLIYQTEAMYMDREGTLWISVWHQGIFSMKTSHDPVTNERCLNPETLAGHSVNSEGLSNIYGFFEDSDGRLWLDILNEGPPKYLDREKNILVHLVNNPDAEDILPRHSMVMQETDSGTLLALGVFGLYQIVPPFTRISDTELMPGDVRKIEGIPGILSPCLVIDSNMWVGTTGQGLIKYSGHDLLTYTEAEGLAGNEVRSIISDEKGNLWIGTNNGLSKLNVQTGTFTNYYKRHGLPVNQFKYQSVAKGEDGELFFGTSRGMFSFQPDSININQYVSPVKLIDFKIQNRSVIPAEGASLTRSITLTEKIELKHNQNHLTFEFAILNYRDPELNQYKYMLEGSDPDWVYSGLRNLAIYSNLAPGKYNFHVQGANNDGVWNEEGTSLGIVIQPPPWLSWWAYSFYVLILLGIILAYRRYLIKRAQLRTDLEIERLEKEKIREVDHMRSRFFANISHEFRTPLTLLINPIEDAMKQEQEDIRVNKRIMTVMQRNARRLQNLINQLLDISRIETGNMKLQLSKANLSEFIKVVASSFQSLAESRHIDYQIVIRSKAEDACFDGEKTEKIIMNLLSNAFKFTEEGGCVCLELDVINSMNGNSREAVIKVSDDGKGMEGDQLEKIFDRFYQVAGSDTREVEGSGIGLALTRELLELMHGTIKVESAPGKGTSFIITFPVSEESFSEHELANMKEAELLATIVPPDENETSETPEFTDEARGKELVLVVEDNPDLRLYITDKLRTQFNLIEAENGEAGLRKAIEKIPDLVITDLMMPVMGGMEFCRKLKEHSAINHIPVIMLTARADKDSRLKGFEAAADDYISKPFDTDLLIARVKNLITQRNELRKHFEKELILSGHEDLIASPQFSKLREIVKIVNANLDDADFEVEALASYLNMSRRGVFRKIQAVAGMTPHELLRIIRMKKAASLLRKGDMNVTEVMYQVGMRNLSHFAISFRKYFGVNPGEYKNQTKD